MSKVLIEGSARHLHLTETDLATLFGAGSVLHPKKELSQPGQYACEERVKLTGPRGSIDRVSVLGPCRSETQVEISLTDARVLGINPPVRLSGDIADSAPLTLEGPAGKVELTKGAIAAKRHIHLNADDAKRFGISADCKQISIKTEGERAVTFHNVMVRIHPEFAPAVHLDIDEMNAAGLAGEVYGEVIVD